MLPAQRLLLVKKIFEIVRLNVTPNKPMSTHWEKIVYVQQNILHQISYLAL